MNLAKEIGFLLQKEWRLEMRQKYALGSILLYVISTVFVCYLSFQKIISIETWNGLFWIILLFAATNAISKSFSQESRGNQLYQYTLVSPEAAILAKIIYNLGLMLVVSALSLICFSLFLGGEVFETANVGMYVLCILLGSFGFAAVFSMISAIASKTGNGLGMMAILGFPVILPLLLTAMKASKQALFGMGWQTTGVYLGTLLLIILLVMALSYILFPYLWRE